MSVDACAALVKRGDPDRFRSAMCAQMPARADLLVFYALNLEIARAPWVTAETMIAEMRLQWWADALGEIAGGGPVRRHEVITPLAELVARHGLDIQMMMQMVEARRFEIYPDAHTDRVAFDRFVEHSAGHVMVLASQILGGAPERIIRDFAYGDGVSRILQALPALLNKGRLPLPAGGLDRNALIEGRLDKNATEMLHCLAEDALKRIFAARRKRSLVPVVARPALLAGFRAMAPLNIARNNPARLWQQNQSQPDMFSLAWRQISGRW